MNNYKKTYWLVVITFVVVAAIVTLTAIWLDSSRDITYQVDDLNEKAQVVSRDFDRVEGMPDTIVEIADEYITVVFKAEDCKLTAHYNRDIELLNTELLDLRIGKNFSASLIMIVSLSALAAVTGCIFTSIGISFYEIYKEARLKQKQK